MPLGSLAVTSHPIPLFAPPYTTEVNSFTNVSCLTVSYRTAYENVRDLVPNMLEIEDEPLISASIVTYGMSTVGAYNEYVHQVEVKYQGEKYNYCLSLILDNESAIFAGREVWGYPKTFGKVIFNRDTGSALIFGHVEKPVGQKIAQFAFTPNIKLPTNAMPSKLTTTLNLRVIPSPVPGSPPSVMELVPSNMEFAGGDVWSGSGSITFPLEMEYHPLFKLRVLRYVGAVFVDGASCTLQPPQATFNLL